MYSLLHQLVFGDDREDDAQSAAEKGEEPAATKPKGEAEMTGTEYYGKLALCVVGLQASYLTWGVLQVTGIEPLLFVYIIYSFSNYH